MVEGNGQKDEKENTLQSNEENAAYMENQHIIITFDNKQLKATLVDNATTRDFVERLPMKITMHDLYNQEKYVKIRGLDVKGTTSSHYSKGDISYWVPGEAFVFYYKGEQEPLNGLVKMGEILEGVEILKDYPSDIKVTIDKE